MSYFFTFYIPNDTRFISSWTCYSCRLALLVLCDYVSYDDTSFLHFRMCLGAEEILNRVSVPPWAISRIPQNLYRLNKSRWTQPVTGCCHLFEIDQKEWGYSSLSYVSKLLWFLSLLICPRLHMESGKKGKSMILNWQELAEVQNQLSTITWKQEHSSGLMN